MTNTTKKATGRIVISKSSTRKGVAPEGRCYTEQVVYREQVGKKKNGKPAYTSITRHEQIR